MCIYSLLQNSGAGSFTYFPFAHNALKYIRARIPLNATSGALHPLTLMISFLISPPYKQSCPFPYDEANALRPLHSTRQQIISNGPAWANPEIDSIRCTRRSSASQPSRTIPRSVSWNSKTKFGNIEILTGVTDVLKFAGEACGIGFSVLMRFVFGAAANIKRWSTCWVSWSWQVNKFRWVPAGRGFDAHFMEDKNGEMLAYN